MKKTFLFVLLLLIVACGKTTEKKVTETMPAEEPKARPVEEVVVPTEVKEEPKAEEKAEEEKEEEKKEVVVKGTITEPRNESSSLASGEVTVEISGFMFEPRVLTVKKGTKVTWVVTDTAKHQIFARDRKEFKSPIMKTGDSFSHTFEKAGQFDYLNTACTGCGWYTIIVEE